MNAGVRQHTAWQDNDSGEQIYGTRVRIGRNVMGRTRVLKWDSGNVTGEEFRGEVAKQSRKRRRPASLRKPAF